MSKSKKSRSRSSSSSSSTSSESSSSSSSSTKNDDKLKKSRSTQKKAQNSHKTKTRAEHRHRSRSRSRSRSKNNSPRHHHQQQQQQQSKWDSPEQRKRRRSDSRNRRDGGGGGQRGGRERRDDSRDRMMGRRRDERREPRGREVARHQDGGDRSRQNERRQRSRSRSRSRSPNRRDRNDRSNGDRGRRDYPPHWRSNSRTRTQAPSQSHRSYEPRHRRRDSRDDENKTYEWGKQRTGDNHHQQSRDGKSTRDAAEPVEKEKPNFALSGALTEDTNKVNGVVVKYSEPLEARKPKRRWRLYPFKGETALPTLHIHRQSCFLVGRDRKVVDLAVDHPSCSKQHAALQYRLVPFEREDGTQGKRVRLYIIDLESANGTFLNNKKIDARKYYELMEKDVIKFGFSSREYVLLHENSKEDQEDDDIDLKQEPADEETQRSSAAATP